MALDPTIVARFKHKVMAIEGYEVDQVTTDAQGIDHSVPINHVYNHHYELYLLGAQSTLELVHGNEQTAMGHGHVSQPLNTMDLKTFLY